MNLKRRLVPIIGAFVTIWVTEFVLHHVVLGDFYKAHAEWWRPEVELKSMLPLMFLAQMLLAWLLTMVYAKGYETGKGGMTQGLRFGLLMGFLLMAPTSLMNLVVYPYPSSLILTWFFGGLIEIALAGAVIGALYKPSS